MRLTDARIKSLKPADKAYKASDADGLYLLIAVNGTKSWRFDYRFAGKRQTLTIGVYPEVSLQEARLRCQEARKLMAAGVNPAVEKKETKARLKTAHANTFQAEEGNQGPFENGSRQHLSSDSRGIH